jgi:PhnB protein
MPAIHVYLSFNGNCREAMHFYKECLGGELLLQTVGASPQNDPMPARMKNFILHALLKKEGLVLMASDMPHADGLQHGNHMSLLLRCNSEAEVYGYYKKLSVGGKATHPPATTHWGALLGNLTDKYGHRWLLHWQKHAV